MLTIDKLVEQRLDEIFQDRVRTDIVERKMYSYDVGALPGLVKPFLPIGIPGAVVRPDSHEQLIQLVTLANEENLKLVPRGMSTSGFGGVLPEEGAIVVDLSGMNRVLTVDHHRLEVTVEAGIIWEQLQRKLHKEKLDLILYPSSLPSSTVGGLLAQGGTGFGGYEYGVFKENVLEAKVILPDGKLQVFSGHDLMQYIADLEGITGIITEITMKVRRLEDEIHRLIAFPTNDAIGNALIEISQKKLPIWSLTFLNPESTKLKKRLPHRHGHKYEEKLRKSEPELPETFTLMVAYPVSRHDLIDADLKDITAKHDGYELPAPAAEHEWSERFRPMRFKRIGPSMIPTEVVVPLKNLAKVLSEIETKIKHPFVLEGMVAKGDKVILQGFIPHDERTFAFNMAFALSLSVIEIAKKHGGSAYATGLYFRREAKTVLGNDRYEKVQTYKANIDPKGLFNPNKVIGSGMIDKIMGTASSLEALIRPFANAATAPFSEAVREGKKKGIPGDIAYYATACSRCGYCVSTCEQFAGRGWESQSPRGKYHYLREVIAGREKFNPDTVSNFLLCTTCEVCNTRCQLDIPVEHNWMDLRGTLIHEEKRMTFPPFEMMAASLRGERNIWAGKKEKRADWVPEDIKAKIKDKADILYFAGCTASFVNTDVAESSVRLLTEAGIDFTYMGGDEACCGIPMKVSGKWDVFEEIFEHNVAEAKKRGAKTIVTSCPACGLVWKELYAELAAKKGIEYDFEVKHYSEIAAEAFKEGKLKFTHEVNKRVTFHDSCHAGRAQGIYEPPRDLLKAIPGVDYVDMEHNREEGYCCGSVLTLIGETPVAPKLGGMRLQEAVDVKANTVVALCPCCQVQLRDSNVKNELGLEITDLARFVMEGLGYHIKDQSEYSIEMWGYFEKFILLMKPEVLADIMASLFKPMFEAMPSAMVSMMKAMKHTPGGLNMMAKMMPTLMPKLVPDIMPKVMPDMLAEVSRRVGPLPEDMEELMPDLLPKTMDSLMPNMLPLIIPHITPRMIEYIKTEL
ncbi:FAD-binding oxidoreductase [Bacillus sp. DNRA2]|uniref:FAD-binding and (Fe-S)-binding domain-containing protein n=1 Tax=Bacillus sp. DNRA2 TaxID=2723053 RepID=UPI00145FBC54|nr:FAD-binding and (Fe-S)-binding domain-containing protein [Bacillus sp. DNRA2]NMD72663.1 FAD-binding oxidoreductase [Bacillus sp. DNRA2]